MESETQFPSDANGEVFRRLKKSGLDFSKPHDVDFFAIFPTKLDAKLVGKPYIDGHKAGFPCRIPSPCAP